MRVAASFVVLLMVVAGCGSGGAGATSGSGPGSTGIEPASSPPQPGSDEAEIPCGAGGFLALLKRRLDGSEPKLRVVRVRVVRCRNGFALVEFAPDRSVCQPGVGYCYDDALVYLAWNGAAWRVVEVGTGIGCSNWPLPGRDLRICKALGYPVLEGRTFQTPSRNIGCTVTGVRLRCDIRSGLSPAPLGHCAGDWVGVVLPADGAGRANCAGDSTYDSGAQVFPYGWVWGNSSFTCRSQITGLDCANYAGHGFSLARQRWIVS